MEAARSSPENADATPRRAPDRRLANHSAQPDPGVPDKRAPAATACSDEHETHHEWHESTRIPPVETRRRHSCHSWSRPDIRRIGGARLRPSRSAPIPPTPPIRTLPPHWAWRVPAAIFSTPSHSHSGPTNRMSTGIAVPDRSESRRHRWMQPGPSQAAEGIGHAVSGFQTSAKPKLLKCLTLAVAKRETP